MIPVHHERIIQGIIVVYVLAMVAPGFLWQCLCVCAACCSFIAPHIERAS